MDMQYDLLLNLNGSALKIGWSYDLVRELAFLGEGVKFPTLQVTHGSKLYESLLYFHFTHVYP